MTALPTSMLRLPGDPLARVRLLILLFGYVNMAAFGLRLFSEAPHPISMRMGALCALGFAAWRWFATYADRHQHLAYDVMEVAALAVAASASTDPGNALALFYLGISLRSMYCTSWNRVYVAVALYIAAYMGVRLASPAPISLPSLLEAVPGFVLAALITHTYSATELKRRDAARRADQSEARGTAIMDSALDCVIIADYQGNIVDFNQAAEAIFGYRRSEVVGKSLGDTIIPPSLRVAHKRGMVRYLTTGQRSVLGKRTETTGMRSDGSEFPIEVAITTVEQDEVPLFVAYLRDITDSKRDEEKLRLAQEKYRRLVEKLPAIVYTAEFGEDGRWSYVGPQIETILGFTPEEWLSDPGMWFAQVHPDDRERVLDEETRTETRSSEFVSEYRMLHRDGRVVWVRDEGLVVNEDGRSVLYGVLLDITREKQLAASTTGTGVHETLTDGSTVAACAAGAVRAGSEDGENGGRGEEAVRATILVAEDEQRVLALVRRILENGGFQVLAARSGQEAIELLNRHGERVDLLVTDVVMPELSGKELSRRVGSLQGDLKTIYMSGYPEQMIANQGVLTDGEWFLYKPFTAERLLSKVRHALGSN